MSVFWIGLLGAMALGVGLAVAARASAGGVHPHPGESLDGVRSVGDLIAAAGDRPVHIVFVHGIRATGPGTSAVFRAGLCRHVGDGCREDPSSGAAERRMLDLGPYAVIRYMDDTVWPDAAAWAASRPFVDRYVFRRDHGGPIVVDEVNWWTLLFPLKCKYLLLPETQLSGADKTDLRLCARSDPPYYPWVSEAEVDAAIAAPPRYSGGAWANRGLKAMIMNWGFSDAVITLSPLRRYVRQAMDQAFGYAATFDGHAAEDQTFVVVSESLGSFAVLDAFHAGHAPSVRRVLANTYDLYFFANQFRLLELARLQVPRGEGGPTAMPDTEEEGSGASTAPSSALRDWAASTTVSRLSPGPAQIVAFNDPSDLLTFEVPPIPNARVVNLYDRNEFDFFGLLADPVAAHTGHSHNPGVLEFMFERRTRR